LTDSPSFLDHEWREFSRRLYGPSREGLDFGLDRIERALALEGRPDRAAPAVLVAGTNGKGGSAAFLAGVLQAHDLRVGLFTSPHLLELRERFRIDGRPAPQELVRRIGSPLVQRYGGDRAGVVEGAAPGGEGPELTFFELTTLMAASIFEAREVDVAIYEVGMGGRLDATNAVDPALSVITSIARDHAAFLGETIEEIAAEKAGILRPNVPAVVGFQDYPSAVEVFEARRSGETTRFAGRDFAIDRATGEVTVGGRAIRPCSGEQRAGVTLRNAAVGSEAARLFLGEQFELERATEGLRRTRWPGRYDRRVVEPETFGADRPVEVWLDAAHNSDAVRELLEAVAGSNFRVSGVVVGGMTDKDLGEMFRRLAGGPPVWGAEIEGTRSAKAEGLRSLIPSDVFRGVGPVARVLAEAVRVASADPEGGILCFGSTYLIGRCLDELGVEVEDLVTYLSERRRAR